jgi:2,5-furandicarboxylate decarboxylase 1
VDDYKVIGGIMNEPLTLVESETWGKDFMVPADAEIVIEGEVLPGVKEMEAPFGEWPGYYGPQRLSQVIDVKAITHRKNAMWQDVFVSHRENWVLGGIPKEGEIFEAVRAYVPTVRSVHFPFSGNCRLICYISVDKQEDGDARQAALIALAHCDFLKYVVVVDGDVDPFMKGRCSGLWQPGVSPMKILISSSALSPRRWIHLFPVKVKVLK